MFNMNILHREPREGSLFYAINKGLRRYLENSGNGARDNVRLEIEQLEQIIKAVTVVSLSNNKTLFMMATNTHLRLDNISFTLEEVGEREVLYFYHEFLKL